MEATLPPVQPREVEPHGKEALLLWVSEHPLILIAALIIAVVLLLTRRAWSNRVR